MPKAPFPPAPLPPASQPKSVRDRLVIERAELQRTRGEIGQLQRQLSERTAAGLAHEGRIALLEEMLKDEAPPVDPAPAKP